MGILPLTDPSSKAAYTGMLGYIAGFHVALIEYLSFPKLLSPPQGFFEDRQRAFFPPPYQPFETQGETTNGNENPGLLATRINLLHRMATMEV